MKEDIAKIAGEYITIEGNADYEKAIRLIQEKGIIPPGKRPRPDCRSRNTERHFL